MSTKASNHERKRLAHAENDPYGLIVFWSRLAASKKLRALTSSLMHLMAINGTSLPPRRESPVMLTYLSVQAISAKPKGKQASLLIPTTNLTEPKS